MLIRGFLDLIQHTLKDEKIKLEYDWCGDAISWCEQMQNLVTEPDYIRLDEERLKLRLEPTDIYSDVIAPLCRVRTQTLPYRKSNKYLNQPGHMVPPQYTIELRPFEFRQHLWVDKPMMQQVFFNLLDNAIKYVDPDRRGEFHIVIGGKPKERI